MNVLFDWVCPLWLSTSSALPLSIGNRHRWSAFPISIIKSTYSDYILFDWVHTLWLSMYSLTEYVLRVRTLTGYKLWVCTPTLYILWVHTLSMYLPLTTPTGNTYWRYQLVILNGNADNWFMQIINSAAAATVSTLIHCSYGKIISMEINWISWLEMTYCVNQWAFPSKPKRVKTNWSGGMGKKIKS